MSIESTIADAKDEVTIRISGRFDYGVNREFRASYSHSTGPGTRYVVDLRSADYIDSSALGMLLVLRDFAGGERSDVTIKVMNPQVRKILDIANFSKLFKLS